MSEPERLTMYHIPGCPFSERVEILLELKGLGGIMADVEIDISKPRPDWLLKKTRGTTALPALTLENGETLKESMVIMRYFEDRFPERPVAQADPYRHAVEGMLCATDGAYSGAGYRMILNRDPAKRDELKAEVDAQYARLDDFLSYYSPDGTFLFDDFGWAEVAFTPMFKRLWFLDYYEAYEIQHMLKHGGGTIVNTASQAGLTGLAGVAIYAASKHGVVGLTKSAALDVAQQGIRINAVAPGPIETGLLHRMVGDAIPMSVIASQVPMGRIAQPEEVAEGILWLASDNASFVTGHTLAIDGGLTVP